MSDLIERDKVMNILEDMDVGIIPYAHARKYAQITIDHIRKELGDIPSARPKGKWIDMGDFEQCSICKGTHLKEVQTYYGKATWIKTNFCSNCGADMTEREGE